MKFNDIFSTLFFGQQGHKRRVETIEIATMKVGEKNNQSRELLLDGVRTNFEKIHGEVIMPECFVRWHQGDCGKVHQNQECGCRALKVSVTEMQDRPVDINSLEGALCIIKEKFSPTIASLSSCL